MLLKLSDGRLGITRALLMTALRTGALTIGTSNMYTSFIVYPIANTFKTYMKLYVPQSHILP